MTLMICRIWHGWTTEENAEAYEHLLRNEVFPNILRRRISGFQAIDSLKHPARGGVEFVTMMWFHAIETVQRFAGPDYEDAVVPATARQRLLRFDGQSVHDAVIGRQPA